MSIVADLAAGSKRWAAGVPVAVSTNGADRLSGAVLCGEAAMRRSIWRAWRLPPAGDGRAPALGCSCRLPSGVGLCCVSRAGLLLASNDRRLGGAVDSSDPARRAAARSQAERTPAWRCQARTSLLLAVVN